MQLSKVSSKGVSALLAVSATLIYLAPLSMPNDYSVVSNVISESAAQGVDGAWIAKLGFVCFGFGVLWLALANRGVWQRGSHWFHLSFGVFMILTAAFSHKPWKEGIPFDEFEDLLHSITATAMGFSFSFGVLVRIFERGSGDNLRRSWDLVALIAATAIPLLGWQFPSIDGLLQRALFAIAYVWYGAEALSNRIKG